MTLRYLRTGGGRALTCFNFSQSHWLLPTSAVPNTTSSSLQCTHLSVILSTVACFLSSALYKSRSIKQYGQCMGCYIKSVRCMVAIALDCIRCCPGGSRGQFHFLSCFCLYRLPQKYYLKPWEILSQISQSHNIIIVMLIYSNKLTS